jgi:hypothetical protein
VNPPSVPTPNGVYARDASGQCIYDKNTIYTCPAGGLDPTCKPPGCVNPGDMVYATCPAGEVAIMGGVDCHTGYALTDEPANWVLTHGVGQFTGWRGACAKCIPEVNVVCCPCDHTGPTL